ncbi:MAG: ABC transporter permease [Actinomycetota bacterium]
MSGGTTSSSATAAPRLRKAKNVALIVFKAVLVLFLATFGVTLLVRLLPGDPAITLLPYGTPEQHDSLRQTLGLNDNVFVYYFKWLGNFLQGDFGYFYSANTSEGAQISTLIGNVLPRSMLIMVYTMIFSLIISIPLAVTMAYKADGKFDRISNNIVFALSSIPNFAIALILMYLFAVQFEIFPAVGYTPMADSFSEHLKSVALPVFSLSIGLIATQTRLLRGDMIATLKEDFVTMASSKGLSDRYILWRHAFRPSSLTLMTSAALNMGSLIGGAVIIESIFALDGFGLLLTTSLNSRQYLGIQSLVALVTIFYVLFNAIVDTFYAIVDPRVRSHRGAA